MAATPRATQRKKNRRRAQDARVGCQKAIGEQVVDAPGQRIRRVVRPAMVRRQTGLERDQLAWLARGHFTFEQRADVGDREQVAIAEELQDGVDQRSASTAASACL